jgi:hypothetical protein
MKTLEILQSDDTFRVDLVEIEGRHAIRKSVQPSANERRRGLLTNEIAGMDYFYQLASAHSEWQLRVPQTLSSGEGWVVREFIEGEALLEKEDDLDGSIGKLTRLATLLAAIDDVIPGKVKNEADNSAPYTNIRKRFDVWSAGPLKEGILSAQVYAAANALIEEYQPLLEPFHAHGDFTPFKHVLMMPNSEFGLIDFEHFSTDKPRYYDLAYAYSRLFTQGKDRRLAGELLRLFTEKARLVPHQKEQILAIMTQRAIGMHFDALNDASRGVDYIDRAQQFLNLCLTRDVTSLIESNGV